MPDTLTDLRVLVFAPFGKDAALIERVLAQSAITICTLPTFQQLEDAISEHAGAADRNRRSASEMGRSARSHKSFPRSLHGPIFPSSS